MCLHMHAFQFHLNFNGSNMRITYLAIALAVCSACVSASAETTATTNEADAPFTWNNATVYFVITDRFANGDPSNDNSYGRPKKDTLGGTAGTFHGGDIKGLTAKLDYLRSLGINAIWLSAPYEQAHGWVGGGGMGNYAYYAYHGYYGLDFTSMDANMGTIEDFRNFVTEAHKRGIRVVMDVVMNHTGYGTLKDMCEFNFGKTKDNWDPCKEWIPSKGESYHNKPIDESRDPKWDRWWGKDWILHGGYGEGCGAGDGLDACVAYLPDFKNSNPHAPIVKVPTFLQEKWSKPDPDYRVPAAEPYRSGEHSVAEFQAHWLASWVEEFGVDGFRCDTAKHVAKDTWGLMKSYCSEALKKWRKNHKGGDDPAANWTDDFWTVGEHWYFGNDAEDHDGYGSKGGFNAMIDFSFNNSPGSLNACIVPTQDDWEYYATLFGVGEGSPKLNALSYVSSHDTSLCRKDDMRKVATGLVLLPGDVQIYYGDETSRVNDQGAGSGDLEQGTRSDMNFPADIDNAEMWAENVLTLSKNYAQDPVLAHWQKLGQFRLRNAAVGAGKQTKLDDDTYCRIYRDATKGIDDSIVIYYSKDKAKEVKVKGCFADGTQLQDGYSGNFYTVSSGKVALKSPATLVLLETKR